MHNPARAPERARSVGWVAPMTSRPEGATILTPRQDDFAECGALTGAEAEKRSFRPRRALRALADGYANGALRALPLARLHFTTQVVINKIGTLTSFETPHFATKTVSISVLLPPEWLQSRGFERH